MWIRNADRPPGPGEAHPAYSPADLYVIRHWLDTSEEHHLVLPPEPGFAVVCGCEEANRWVGRPRTRVFAAMNAGTPAPWAVTRFMYVYNVAVDDLGRMVASEHVESWYEPLDATNRAALALRAGLS